MAAQANLTRTRTRAKRVVRAKGRAGRNLPAARKRALAKAKQELRKLYGRSGRGVVAPRRSPRRMR
jgi:hypothetical protein